MTHARPLLAWNLLLALALVCLPLGLEAIAGINGDAPGKSIRLLLYWPFDFGFLVLALVAFLALNIIALRRRRHGALIGAAAGLLAGATWAVTAVLLSFQVHLWRGGQL